MNILHVPFTYYPDACGGTEVYVASLCRFLDEAGVRNAVAAPGDRAARYEHDGIPVHRFATHEALTQAMMYGEGDPVAAAGFAKVLDEARPDLVHFHAFTPAAGVLCLREARQRGIPAITTYHTPTNSCLRGTLMRWGITPCDGEIRTGRCAACLLNAHGMPKAVAQAAAFASRFTRPLAALPGLSNAARAVLGSTALVAMRQAATQEWWAGMRQVVALCEWTRQLLLANGVPAARIPLVRHGLPSPMPAPAEASSTAATLPLKLVFFGRADPTKGIDLIIRALRLTPELRVTLDLYVIALAENDANTRAIRALAGDDARITFRPPVPSDQVESILRGHDVLLAPSRCLETGPLVVLEAFAAGVPVVGSALGGIAERITHEVDGLLVREVTPQAWREALLRLAADPALLPRLRAGITPPRTMRYVAAEMLEIYRNALATKEPMDHKG